MSDSSELLERIFAALNSSSSEEYDENDENDENELSPIEDASAAIETTIDSDPEMIVETKNTESQEHIIKPPDPSTLSSDSTVEVLDLTKRRVETRDVSSTSGQTFSSFNVKDVIPTSYHSIFPFKTFNVLQQKTLHVLLRTTKNVVIAAPTASGKTACLEIAIVKMLHTQNKSTRGKIVYMAPNKALCDERYESWKATFETRFDMKVELLTGDSQRKGLEKKIRRAHMVMTTPEKFDSFTRRWHDKQAFIGQIGLLLLDEIHALGEKRGGTLESVITRMKRVRQASHCRRRNWPVTSLRMVALSATLPNASDIATFLECDDNSLIVCGDEVRPVKLERHSLGYRNRTNPFTFMRSLLNHIDHVISSFSDGCPSLVFCATRKDSENVASKLAGMTDREENSTYWRSSQHCHELQHASRRIQSNDHLKECIRRGVCYHNGGLSRVNRSVVESLFRSGKLAVCCTTTTLAQGVNLPARLVVVMSTMQWRGPQIGYAEYPRSTVLQMIGRAGRPQYDTVARAVIMTQQKTLSRYEQDMKGGTVVESVLKNRLTEYLNTEIALGTIRSHRDAAQWLESTLLYIRAKRNPIHYGLTSGSEEEMNEFVQRKIELAVKQLEETGMVVRERGEGDNEGEEVFKSTDTGRVMCRYFLHFQTVHMFASLVNDESTIVKAFQSGHPQHVNDDLSELLWRLSSCPELTEVGIRKDEKKIVREYQGRFALLKKRGAVTAAKKCFQVLQAHCDRAKGYAFSESRSIQMQTSTIVQNASRVLSGMKAYFRVKNSPFLYTSLTLIKCLEKRMWENGKNVMMQARGVGLSTSRKLVQAGLVSFEKIKDAPTAMIRRAAGRKYPFGAKLKEKMWTLIGKSFDMSVTEIASKNNLATYQIQIVYRDSEMEKRAGKTKLRHSLLAWIACAESYSKLNLNMTISAPTTVRLLITNEDLPKRKLNGIGYGHPYVLKCRLICHDVIGIDSSVSVPIKSHNSTHMRTSKVGSKRRKTVQNDGLSNVSRQPNRGPKRVSTHPPSHVLESNDMTSYQSVNASISTDRVCNHRCKNKRTCGHRCCQEGVKSQKENVTAYYSQRKGSVDAIHRPKSTRRHSSQPQQSLRATTSVERHIRTTKTRRQEPPKNNLSRFGFGANTMTNTSASSYNDDAPRRLSTFGETIQRRNAHEDVLPRYDAASKPRPVTSYEEENVPIGRLLGLSRDEHDPTTRRPQQRQFVESTRGRDISQNANLVNTYNRQDVNDREYSPPRDQDVHLNMYGRRRSTSRSRIPSQRFDHPKTDALMSPHTFSSQQRCVDRRLERTPERNEVPGRFRDGWPGNDYPSSHFMSSSPARSSLRDSREHYHHATNDLYHSTSRDDCRREDRRQHVQYWDQFADDPFMRVDTRDKIDGYRRCAPDHVSNETSRTWTSPSSTFSSYPPRRDAVDQQLPPSLSHPRRHDFPRHDRVKEYHDDEILGQSSARGRRSSSYSRSPPSRPNLSSSISQEAREPMRPLNPLRFVDNLNF